jgi:hypothetical protein
MHDVEREAALVAQAVNVIEPAQQRPGDGQPSRPVLLFSNVPGATRFALAPGYHLPRLRRSNDHLPRLRRWLRPSAAPAAL